MALHAMRIQCLKTVITSEESKMEDVSKVTEKEYTEVLGELLLFVHVHCTWGCLPLAVARASALHHALLIALEVED